MPIANNATIASRKTLLVLIAINALTFVFALLAQPKAIDFRAFYFSGETARRAPDHLYDLKYQLREQQAEFNDRTAFLPFFHPPHELLLFAPLSMLPYTTALMVWRLFSLLCLTLSGLILAETIGGNRLDTVLLIAAVYPVLMCLTLGQDSLLLLLLVSGCFYLLKANRNLWAAAVLALALFKPQLPVVLALAMLAAGKKRFFAWFVVFGGALMAASMMYVGWPGVLRLMRAPEIGEMGGYGVSNMPTIRGLLAFAGHDSRWFALALLAAAILAMLSVWRASRSLEFAVASSICLGSALVLYIYPYDLVLLAIPLLIVLDAVQRHELTSPIVTPVVAAITSGPLGLLAYRAKMPFLLLLPTLALGWMTFKLRRVSPRDVGEPLPGLAADADTGAA